MKHAYRGCFKSPELDVIIEATMLKGMIAGLFVGAALMLMLCLLVVVSVWALSGFSWDAVHSLMGF